MERSQQAKTASKIFSRATFEQRAIAAVVFLIVAALFCPVALAAHGRFDIGAWLGPCGFKRSYNLPCPACGITTAAIAFAQGRLGEAFYLQPAGALLCCLLVISALLAFFTAVSGLYFNLVRRFFAEVKIWHLVLAFLIIIAAGWAVTLARQVAETYR